MRNHSECRLYLGVIWLAMSASTCFAGEVVGCSSPGANTLTCVGGPGASVTIPSSNGFTPPHTVTGSPFPTSIIVSGAPAGSTVATVSLTLNGYTAAAPTTGDNSADVGILLADPNNNKNLQIMRCAGNGGAGSSQAGVNITIVDTGLAIPACAGASRGNWVPGSGSSWAPSAYDDTARDSEASPSYGFSIYNSAASLGTGTLNGVFEGEPVNGTWSLYLADDGIAEGAAISFPLEHHDHVHGSVDPQLHQFECEPDDGVYIWTEQ